MTMSYRRTVMTVFVGVVAGTAGSAAHGEAGLAALSEKDRMFIEEHLGAGFLGEPVEPPVIGNAEKFLGIADGARWEFQRVRGDQPLTLTFTFVDASSAPRGWRIDHDNKNVRLGTMEDDGSLRSYSLDDAKEGLTVRMEPPDPFFISNVGLRSPTSGRVDIKMVETAGPDKVKYEGFLDVSYEYLGAHRVTVPAGTYETAVVRWTYEGKVGPASITDVQYYFFADGVGPVALVENKEVAAFIVYRKTIREIAKLSRRN